MQMLLKPRNWSVLLAALLLGLILTPLIAPANSADQNPAAGGAPRAVFPEIRYDFNSVMEGIQVKHDFYVENTGKAPLRIEKVRPS